MDNFFKNQNQNFGRFQGQFDLEDQDQGHQFLNRDLYVINTWFKFKFGGGGAET